MELSSIRSLTPFRANEKEKTHQTYTTTPVQKTPQATDVFVSGTKIVAKPIGSLFGKFVKKVKETVSAPETQQKINNIKITNLLVKNGSISITDVNKHKDIINELAKQDYEKVEQKYNAIIKNYQLENKEPYKYKDSISLKRIAYPLQYEKLEAEDIDEIFNIKRTRPKDSNPHIHNDLEFVSFVQTMKLYDNFDNLPASTQKNLIASNSYKMPTFNTLTIEEAKKVSESSSLMKFDYIKDLRSVESNEEFIQKMDTRRRNIPCKPIPTSAKYFKSEEDIKNLSNALNNTDLTKYQKGFTLEYSRENFINDFNTLVKDYSEDERQKIFNNLQFKINTSNDIINYPNPCCSEDIPEPVQKLVNKFMLENKVKLDPQDKALETELNKIIKAYPEFISIIGKIQHRGDSIDYHTMDDMKRILNDPNFATLPKQEQKILTTATLFHDFGKTQGEVDEGHAKKSAILAKEIIKKTDFSLDEKERIFNLINHSHWLIDGSSEEDIAFCFRRTNDFKMAEIFEKADSNSAGFEYAPTPKKISEIQNNIEKINSTGNLLFTNSLPKEDKYYDKTSSGIRYLDLRDPEMSVEKYGYPAGTKVKDLKFLCHSSSDDQDNFKALCDDSKEVCLSTSLLDYRNRFCTGYNGMGAYIINSSNANIILGGKDVACTGGHRGYNYAKDSSYSRDSQGFITNMKTTRAILPNQVKTALDLSDEEYTELYTKISNIENLEDIPDINLKNGRLVKSCDVQKAMNEIQKELVRPKGKEEGGYTNEIVVYNPKIEGEVVPYTPEQLEKFSYTDSVYVLV